MHESFRMHRAANREGLYRDYNRIEREAPYDLLTAAQQGELDAVITHIGERGSDRDARGRTALCLAAENGHSDVVKQDVPPLQLFTCITEGPVTHLSVCVPCLQNASSVFRICFGVRFVSIISGSAQCAHTHIRIWSGAVPACGKVFNQIV